MNKEIINTIQNLSRARMKFSPRNIITKYKLEQKNNNTFIVDLSQITDKTNKQELLNIFLYDYNGTSINNLMENYDKYTIYYEIQDESLIGGIYDINTEKKLSSVVFIHNNNYEATIDSQYIYSPHSDFYIELRKKAGL